MLLKVAALRAEAPNMLQEYSEGVSRLFLVSRTARQFAPVLHAACKPVIRARPPWPWVSAPLLKRHFFAAILANRWFQKAKMLGMALAPPALGR